MSDNTTKISMQNIAQLKLTSSSSSSLSSSLDSSTSFGGGGAFFFGAASFTCFFAACKNYIQIFYFIYGYANVSTKLRQLWDSFTTIL